MICERITLILLSIPNACWRDVKGREIPTEHDHFGDKIHFHAIVEHFSDPLKRRRMVQPHIREDEEVEIGKLLFDPNCISGLGGY
jgi:hypothetical protein